MNTGEVARSDVVYWHRELPPGDAELLGDHTIEATSGRVPGTLSHRDDIWDRCYYGRFDYELFRRLPISA